MESFWMSNAIDCFLLQQLNNDIIPFSLYNKINYGKDNEENIFKVKISFSELSKAIHARCRALQQVHQVTESIRISRSGVFLKPKEKWETLSNPEIRPIIQVLQEGGLVCSGQTQRLRTELQIMNEENIKKGQKFENIINNNNYENENKNNFVKNEISSKLIINKKTTSNLAAVPKSTKRKMTIESSSDRSKEIQNNNFENENENNDDDVNSSAFGNLAKCITLDSLSHLLIKFAFCQDAFRTDWFIQRECELLRIKLIKIGRDYLNNNSQNFSIQFFDDLIRHLKINSSSSSQILIVSKESLSDLQKEFFYGDPLVLKMSFMNCPFLRTQNAFPEAGVVSLPISTFPEICSHELKLILKNGTEILQFNHQTFMDDLSNDPILLYWVEVLSKLDVASIDYGEFSSIIQKAKNIEDEKSGFAKLSLQEIDSVMQRMFPPCMRRLMFEEKKNQGLKFNGRLQLWPFLKDVGLSLDEQIQLHGSLFADRKKFEKEHKYTLRHIYGQEGKRSEKSEYRCERLATILNPPVGDWNGCPFRNMNENELNNLLQLPAIRMKQIVESVNILKPDLACHDYLSFQMNKSSHQELGSYFISPDGFFKTMRKITDAEVKQEPIGEKEK